MGESMARDAMLMGLDLTIAPDGREWEESSYRRSRMNREIWGEDEDDYGNPELYSEFGAHSDDDTIDLDDIDIIKVGNTNNYFFDCLENALLFSSKYQPSLLKIANNNSDYYVHTDEVIFEKVIKSKKYFYSLKQSKTIKGSIKETLELLNDELPIEDIAEIRGFTESTIIKHIEDLNEEFGIRFPYLKPNDYTIQTVKKAYREIVSRGYEDDFTPNGYVKLKSIFDMTDIDYDQIRLSLTFFAHKANVIQGSNNIQSQHSTKYMSDTLKETLELLKKKYTVEKIAQIRGLTESTIIKHIEELNEDYGKRFTQIEPYHEIIDEVKNAYNDIISRNDPSDFAANGKVKLKSIFDATEDLDYEQIRLSLIFI